MKKRNRYLLGRPQTQGHGKVDDAVQRYSCLTGQKPRLRADKAIFLMEVTVLDTQIEQENHTYLPVDYLICMMVGSR